MNISIPAPLLRITPTLSYPAFLCGRCGDGSNDVGALRRSHVGLALLSGFGDANTSPSKQAKGSGASKEKSPSVPGAKSAAELRVEESNQLQASKE